MADPDPFAELLAHLERDGAVPLAWVTEHAPDGDLRAVWSASLDVIALLGAAARLAEHTACVRLTARCVRALLARSRSIGPRAAEALDALEAWATGALTQDALATVDDALDRSAGEDDAAGAVLVLATAVSLSAEDRAAVAREAAAAATGVVLHPFAAALAAGRAMVVDDPESLVRYQAESTYWAAHEEHRAIGADIVRAHVPCPALAQLIASYRAR